MEKYIMNNLHDTPLFDCVHATCKIPVFDVMKPYEDWSQTVIL